VSVYQYIARRAGHVPVRQLCHVLREALADHSQRYGTRRLRAEVQVQGHSVGRWRIRRVLREHGLRAQQPRSFVPRTTDSDPAVRAAPNRLLGQPAPTAPNRVWVGDIPYLPRQGGGWLYLATWLDRYSRKIVGFGVAGATRRTCVTRCPKTWSAKPCAGRSWCDARARRALRSR